MMTAVPERTEKYMQGLVVKPEPVQGRTIVSSVAELVHNVMPQQSTSGSSREIYDKVEWVSFDECDLTDLALKNILHDLVGSEPPLIISVGLSNGYQIWALMSNGECEELLSVRTGPVKFVKFLSSTESVGKNSVDVFAPKRPLLIVCDSMCAGQPFCSLNITSLKTGELVHSLTYDEPVGNVLCNKVVIVVGLSTQLTVYDACNMNEMFSVKTDCVVDKMDVIPAALGVSWLAFSDLKLNSAFQSCGGISVCDTALPMASQVMNVAKSLSKTVTTLGETVATSLTGAKTNSRPKSAVQPCENFSVVTVVDVNSFAKAQCGVSPTIDPTGIVAHFVATIDERITAMKFNSNSTLLLVCGQHGQQFQLFAIFPHPSSPTLGAVHHLYTLHRGSTNCKVQDICFARDSRWVAVTSMNGTTHVFPVTPYGGPTNVRTHTTAKLVNRESRFFRSAGLEDLEPVKSGSPPRLSSSPMSLKGPCIAKDTHPSLNNDHSSLSRAISNPRLPPYPSATIVAALAKIKRQFVLGFGSELNIKQNVPAGKYTGDEQQRLCTVFAPLRGCKSLKSTQKFDEAAVGLYLMNCYGELIEHVVIARPCSSASKVSADSPIELRLVVGAQWQLTRQRHSAEILPPLNCHHPLILGAGMAAEFYGSSARGALNEDHYWAANERENGESSAPDGAWISQVEIVTYSGPHRRLWMGPQFTFKTYIDQQQSAALVSPADKIARFGRSEPMAVPGRKPLCSIPVLIEANSMGSMDQTPAPAVEICGSWSDNDYISCDEQEGRLRETIADAMRDPLEFASRNNQSANFAKIGSHSSDRSGDFDLFDRHL